jgi:ABC-type lipoprotein export system ATPase subunit
MAHGASMVPISTSSDKNNHMEPVIKADALTRIYRLGKNDITGIKNINIKIMPRDLLVLKGRSGSGKSTLLALLAGLDQLTSGRLTVAGYDLSKHDPRTLTRFRRQKVGIVFQAFNLMPTLNVIENISLPALLAGVTINDAYKKAKELAVQFNLEKRLDHRPSQLSGGEMQRTAIARALINDPAIIIADEPTGNLDSRSGDVVIDLLYQLNRKWDRTVIIATHSDLADAYATHVIHLKDGEIIHTEIVRNPPISAS